MPHVAFSTLFVLSSCASQNLFLWKKQKFTSHFLHLFLFSSLVICRLFRFIRECNPESSRRTITCVWFIPVQCSRSKIQRLSVAGNPRLHGLTSPRHLLILPRASLPLLPYTGGVVCSPFTQASKSLFVSFATVIYKGV